MDTALPQFRPNPSPSSVVVTSSWVVPRDLTHTRKSQQGFVYRSRNIRTLFTGPEQVSGLRVTGPTRTETRFTQRRRLRFDLLRLSTSDKD